METINKAEKKIVIATKEKAEVLENLPKFKCPAFFIDNPIFLIEYEK